MRQILRVTLRAKRGTYAQSRKSPANHAIVAAARPGLWSGVGGRPDSYSTPDGCAAAYGQMCVDMPRREDDACPVPRSRIVDRFY